MDTFETVQAWLRNTYNIGVSSEWLTACLEWIQQENQGLPLPMNELLSQVYGQWLLSDLSEIGEPVLPQIVVSTDKYELVSNYPLQLLSLIDVGFPLYSQKQKLQGQINANEDVSADRPFQPAWEPKPSRMLLLQLTDGHTQIQAMEYRQIKDLHPMLPSGLKLLVTGTVLCRRGMIMLTPECLQVLGGEVDALAEQNTPLVNLENSMIRNREDEGRHAKKEFSGRFVYRAVDKKLDSSQKTFMTGINQNKHQTRPTFESSKVKLELHEPFTAHQGQASLKLETSQIQKKPEPLHLKQDSNQWNNEVNYDDCFDDELDLEEINAIDSTSTTAIEREMSFKSSPLFVCNPLDKDKFHNVDNTNKMFGTNQALARTQPQQFGDLPNILNSDVEFFDDDFEIDDISSYPAIPNAAQNKEHKLIPSTSSQNNSQSNFKIEGSTFNSKPQGSRLPSKSATTSHQTFTNSSAVHKQNPSMEWSGSDSSPPIPFQDLQSTNTSNKPRISSSTSAALLESGQSVTSRRNKLFRTKSGPQETARNCGTVSRSQTTKQCKLPDMFRSTGSKMKQTSFDEDDCSIINDDIVGHPPPRLTQTSVPGKACHSLSSRLEDTASVKAFKSSRDNSSIAPDSTIRTTGYPYLKMECEQDQDIPNKLPKAVIHPFSLSNDCSDSLDTTDSLPFQYLSELASMQPPATVTVKAYISTLIDKLGSNGGACWSLACRINDGTACLDVDLADSVLAELIGFSAQDSVIMRHKIKTEPRVKDILMQGLSKCQHKLINISCLMEVNAVSVTRKPVIKKLTMLSEQHVNELIKRVERFLPGPL